MPDNSGNAAALRTSGYYAPAYLSDLSGSQVLQATLTATPSFPATSLTVTINSGSVGNVVRGYRIVVTGSAGAYKGTVAVRASGTLDSTHIPVRETGQGAINFVSGDIIYIFDDVMLADKIPTADETFSPDGLAVSDYTSNPPPLPKSGGHYAGWLRWGEVPYTGTGSEYVDPDSNGPVSHLYAGTGSPSFTTGSSSSADPGLTWSAAGKYRVDHTVTDDDNSKSITQCVRVRLHDANDPPIGVMLDLQPSASEDSGWSISVETRESVPVSTLRDGSLVAVWVENGDGTRPTFGSADNGRHHMLMVGYLRRDTNFIRTPSGNAVRFDIISPMAKLAELPGFSKVMERNQTPDAWSKIKTLTIKRAIINLITFYSWLIEAGFDVVFNGFQDADYPLLLLEKNNPLEQLRELALSRASRIVCLRTGRFEIQERLAVQAVSSRAAHTKTYTLAPQDIAFGADGSDGMEMTREHYEPVETFRTQGFVEGTSSDLPTFFGRWPASPGNGNSSDTQTKFVVDSQTHGLEWCAMLGAEVNRTYMVSTTSKQHAPELSVPLVGAYWLIFDFFREWIAFSSYDASSNLRGIDLTAFRWQFTGMSVTWDENLVPAAGVELRAETAGLGAVDDTPPQTDSNPPFDDPFIDWTPFDGEITPLLPQGGMASAYIALSTSDPPVLVIGDLEGNETVVSHSMTGHGMWFISDPYEYSRTIVLTSDGLWVADTPDGTYSLAADNADMFGDAARIGQYIFGSINRQGIFWIVSGANAYATCVDYFSTWQQDTMDNGAASWNTSASLPPAANRGTMGISPQSGGPYGGVLVAVTRTGSDIHIYRNVAWGVAASTWTETDDITSGDPFPRAGGVNIPYNRPNGLPNLPNDAMEVFASASGGDGSADGALWFSEDKADTFVKLIHITNGSDPCRSYAPININDRYAYWVNPTGTNTANVYRYDRQLETYSLMGGITGGIAANIHGWPANDSALLAFHVTQGANDGYLGFSTDGGVTWTDITPTNFADGSVACAQFRIDLVQ